MQVTVRLFASLRQLTGREELKLDLNEGSTLENILHRLKEIFGQQFEEVRTRDPLEAYVKGDGVNPAILLNGRSIDLEKELSTPLKHGDLVVIMPIMASG